VFYLRYVRNELLRRRMRTIVTLAGLGIGVALVIALASLSSGLDRAQKKTLDPLGGLGTDLTVTLSPNQDQGGFGGGTRDLIQANQSVITDLSKLGKPGDHFVHDFFLPGSQLTFQDSSAADVAKLANVSQVASGLTLLAQHQDGVVPKIVAKLKTGGQTFNFTRNIPRPSAKEFQQMQECLQKLGVSIGRSGAQGGQGGGGFRGGGAGGLGGGGGNREAFQKCLPASLKRLRTQFTTPQQTLRQVLDPPQTNIKTTSYTIGGVDQKQPGMGVVTSSQVTKGRFLSTAGGKEALLSSAYAAKQKLKVGSRLALNGNSYVVVGLVDPPLGGQTADVYLPLKQLQTLAKEKGLANVLLVRASDSSKVAAVEASIKRAFPNAQVASAKDEAAKISGSLVDASNLSHDLGFVLSLLAAVAAFLLAALLTISSVGKRVRELGTLKALGWTQRLVVRQVAGESLAQGVVGGMIGIVLGVLIALGVDAFGPHLSASSTTGGSISLPGLANAATRTATSSVSLSAPVSVTIVLIGFGLALLGGLIAGGAGALRAARLRPADALRQVD
jgi:ABC-type antimicrobial peptide transport system permease subunit